MLRIKPFGNKDFNAIHIDGVNEFHLITEITQLDGPEMFILEWPNAANAKRKIQASNIKIADADTTAFHDSQTEEFLALDQKGTPVAGDLFVIEDSNALWGKKSLSFADLSGAIVGATTMDTIIDGVIYKKVLAADNTKLTSIASSAIDIDDAVSKRHTQGTDTTLGIMSVAINMGSNKITDTADPDNPQDVATKNYVDNIGHTDPNAIHKTIQSEISALIEKSALVAADFFLIEDSENSNNKRRTSLQYIHSTTNLDDIQNGIIYNKVPTADATKLASISSSAVDIDDAVAKRHTQGTDTTLGTMTQAIDMGTFKITNAADPDNPQDLATKNYVDSLPPDDPDAFHKNIQSEISALTPKTALVDGDFFLLEDSENSNNKKGTTLQYIHSTTNIDEIQDGVTYSRVPAADATKLGSISSSAANIDDAVAKRHTSGQDVALGIQVENMNMGGYIIGNLGTPLLPNQATNKEYVDLITRHTLIGIPEYHYKTNLLNQEWIDEMWGELVHTPSSNRAMVQGLYFKDGSFWFIQYSGNNLYILERPATLERLDSRLITAISTAIPTSAIIIGDNQDYALVGLASATTAFTQLIYIFKTTYGATTFGFQIAQNVTALHRIKTSGTVFLIGAQDFGATTASIYYRTSFTNIGSGVVPNYTAPATYTYVKSFLTLDNGDILAFIWDTAGIATQIVKSTDNGQTWSQLMVFTYGNVYEGIAIGNSEILVLCRYWLGSYWLTNIMKSKNNGLTWSEAFNAGAVNTDPPSGLYYYGAGITIAGVKPTGAAPYLVYSAERGEEYTWYSSTDNFSFPTASIIKSVIKNQDDSIRVGIDGSTAFYDFSLCAPTYKTFFIQTPSVDAQYGYRLVEGQKQDEFGFLNFDIPADFIGFGPDGGFYLMIIPTAGAAGSGKDIDLYVEYDNGPNTIRNYYTASDTTSVYDLTGAANAVYYLKCDNLLSQIQGGASGGVEIDLNTVGGDIGLFGIKIVYRARTK